MFKLDVNYLDVLVKTAQVSGKIEDPVKQVTQLGLQSSCTVYVTGNNRQWSGSGFHIGNGYLITAGHVVNPDLALSEIKVSFDGENFFDADLVDQDDSIDSAILFCKDIIKTVPALKLGNSDSLEIGDLVIVISAPEGFHDTATYGRVSNINQSVKNVESPAWNDIIFIDADIMEGSSGGMVLGTDGLVYGLIMGVTGSHADIGIGESSVSPSNKIKKLLDKIV